MGDTGFSILGDHILGWSDLEVLVYSDIPVDLLTERTCSTPAPFIQFVSFRYTSLNYIQTFFHGRFVSGVYKLPEATDRKIYVHYRDLRISDRYCSFLPETNEIRAFFEGLLTTTPLTLKYPKYYNWNYIPRQINPKFNIWSFYDLDLDSVTIHITTNNSGNPSLNKDIFLNSGLDSDKFEIIQHETNKKLWEITVFVDEVFENGEEVITYVSMNDVKGNHLKDGLW